MRQVSDPRVASLKNEDVVVPRRKQSIKFGMAHARYMRGPWRTHRSKECAWEEWSTGSRNSQTIHTVHPQGIHKSLPRLWQLLKDYQDATGMRANVNKFEGIRMGRLNSEQGVSPPDNTWNTAQVK